MQKTITLKHDDNTLVGKYSSDCDTVLVLLDSSIRAFSVSLPDLNSSEKHQFLFKNLGANSVTINTINGQIIDYVGIFSQVILSKQFYSVMSDSLEKWVSLESNVDVFGDEANNTTFDSTGHMTMIGNARPWRDEIGDILLLKQQGTGVATNVTESTVEFNTAANLSDYLFTNVQLNHDKDAVVSIYPHIHFFQAENHTPNFLIQYRWQKQTGVAKVTGWTNLKCNTLAFTYTTGTINNIAYSLPVAVPAGTGLSDIVQFRILRDNANTSTIFTGSDPYTATVGLLSFDVHFMINSLGSTDEYTK